MIVPPYVPAAILTVIVAIASDKLKLRGPFVLVLLPITMIGKTLHPIRDTAFSSIEIGYILAIVAKVGINLPPLIYPTDLIFRTILNVTSQV